MTQAVAPQSPSAQRSPALHRWALVVEDDPSDLAFVSEILKREGFSVMGSSVASRAREFLRARAVDLVILDLGLEDESGLELLVDIRRQHQVPVIIATGQADVETAVIGLRLGADDLMVKPFQPALFAARVGAVLRRAGAVRDKETLEFGELRIDLTAREVSLERLPVDMPAREFDLLAFLATHPRQVFTRSQLLEQVWESSSEWQDEATVTEHIRKIRLRIEADPRNPRWISTVRRVGYRFNA